jgi:hypothetical protein
MECFVKLTLLVLMLAGCASQTPTSVALKRQWRKLTDQQRPSFESAGDAMSLAPTPDTGAPFATDPTHDCSSCPPR